MLPCLDEWWYHGQFFILLTRVCVRAGRCEAAVCSGRWSGGAGCVSWWPLRYHFSSVGWRRSAELFRPLQRIPTQRLCCIVRIHTHTHQARHISVCVVEKFSIFSSHRRGVVMSLPHRWRRLHRRNTDLFIYLDQHFLRLELSHWEACIRRRALIMGRVGGSPTVLFSSRQTQLLRWWG